MSNKKMFTKQNIMPVIVLTVICFVIAAVLGVANMLTEDRIAFNEEQKKYESLKVVIDGTFEEVEKPAGAPDSVNGMFKVTDGDGNLKGYAVTLKVMGYESEISITVGVTPDGTVTKAVVTSEAETHGQAGMANYTDRFAGVTKDKVAEVDTYTDATGSSTAIRGAIVDAVNTVTGSMSEPEPEPALPREDSEIIALAKALLGTESELTDVTPEKMEFAKRIYKAGDNGYVAYVLVMSGYGAPETETLIHVGIDGTIKSFNKLVWKTSDPSDKYTPPATEVVDAFYAKLPGKKASDLKALGNADLVSGATNTSTKLRDALVEALEATEILISKDMPTPENELIPMINALVGKELELTNVTPDALEYTKRIYKVENQGYVAYTVVMNTRYGRPETETLVFVGNDGKIIDFTKIVWRPSDPSDKYTPPATEVVDAFYAKLPGKKASDLKALQSSELVSGATSTSTNLRDALVESLEAVEDLIMKDMPTSEENVKALATALVGKTVEFVDVTPRGMSNVRRIFSIGNGEYVVYTVVINARYGKAETETLLYVGEDGKIKNLNRMTWSPSPASEQYTPPSEETVN